MKHSVGLIRVVTSRDEDSLNAHGNLIMSHFPELQVTSRCIPDQPEGIHDQGTEEKAIPKIIALGKELAGSVEAVIISCADDPAIKELREIVKVPVVGAGSATAALAAVYGERVGVLGITREVPAVMARILGDKLVAYERPIGVETTADLRRGSLALLAAARRLAKVGVDTVALGCTGYSTVGFAESFQKRLGVRVVDPVFASGLCTYGLVV